MAGLVEVPSQYCCMTMDEDEEECSAQCYDSGLDAEAKLNFS